MKYIGLCFPGVATEESVLSKGKYFSIIMITIHTHKLAGIQISSNYAESS